MPLLSRKRTILAKAESTYGTDSTPTGAANAILVRNMSVTPLSAELVSRDLVRPYLGASEQLLATAYVSIEFEVEMAGSGTAGTAPAYDALLKACGMTAATSAGVSVTYTPVSASFASVTIYHNVDGVLHKITGARGNVELDMRARQIPVFKFTFTGLYNAPTDTAAPTVSYSAFQTPLALNSDNSSGFSLMGYSGALESLNINLNNAITYRSLIGAEDVLMTDRQAGGSAMIEAPTIAGKDFFAAALAGTAGSLDITHGTTAGNKVQVTSSKLVPQNPTYQDQDGIMMMNIPFRLVPDGSGNNEISIVVK